MDFYFNNAGISCKEETTPAVFLINSWDGGSRSGTMTTGISAAEAAKYHFVNLLKSMFLSSLYLASD